MESREEVLEELNLTTALVGENLRGMNFSNSDLSNCSFVNDKIEVTRAIYKHTVVEPVDVTFLKRFGVRLESYNLD